MSGFYRYGDPGEDTMVHLNTGLRSSRERCRMPRFDKDDPRFGELCGRMSVILCDSKGCDIPCCALHRVKHPTKANTDFCLDHADQAEVEK